MSMHAITPGACANAVRESALKVGWYKNPLLHHQGIEPVSVLYLAFGSDTVPALYQLRPAHFSFFSFFFLIPGDEVYRHIAKVRAHFLLTSIDHVKGKKSADILG